MTADSTVIFDYIFSLTGGDVKLELSRVRQLMALIGDPYRAYPVIHIAGTNGKGSTGSMLASALRGYGYRVGLFTSPHLIAPTERIRIDDQFVPDEFIVSNVERWRPEIKRLGITFFEILTALGMVYFKEQQVDYAVIETGLGGRLDATNVVDPLLSIITSISVDHEAILGDTLEQIASEKAGIIKENKPLVLGKNPDSIQQQMAEICKSRHAAFTYAPSSYEIKATPIANGMQGVSYFSKGCWHEINLPLLGIHQMENFQTVLAALNQMGLELDAQRIQQGLNMTQWPGRLQTLQEKPRVLYDVAHNPGGLERLLESLTGAAMGDAVLIAAFNARKNITQMMHILSDWPGPVLYTFLGGHSALPRENLLNFGVDPSLVESTPADAYAHALRLVTRDDQVICYFGSHYLAEDIYPLFGVKYP